MAALQPPTSASALLQDASRVIPGGVNTGRRKSAPLCARRAEGAYIEDLDGSTWIDYNAAYGPIILGHAYPAVTRRVTAAIRDGVLFGVGTTRSEVELARRVSAHVPSAEQVLITNSGSEATYHAIRLARAVTGRSTIVKFQGCFHGFHDYVLLNTYSPREMVGRRDLGSAGMLETAVDSTLVCRFNDLADVRATAGRSEDIAAIIVEPVLHNCPTILPQAGFLEGLREICDETGALLIFDEVITGFRHHIGGYQAIAGVVPDLTTMAKAMANGFPISAVGGRTEHMERFSTKPGGDVFYSGTYNGNTASVAAALATIDELEDGRLHAQLFRLGERMRTGLGQIAERAGVAAVVSGYGSLFVMLFMEGPLTSYDDVLRQDRELFVRYRQELNRRFILEMPDHVGRSHISASHTEDDIDHTLEMAEEALQAALDGRSRERVGAGARAS